MNIVAAVLASRVGLRVRAPKGGLHVGAGILILEGTLGRTKSCTCAGAIVGVRWDGRDDELDTAFRDLEVVDEHAS